MTIILLGFKIEGKTPSEKEILNSSVNWLEISLLNFKIFVEILSGLTGFRWLRHKMIFLISVLWTGFMKKEVMSKFDHRPNGAWNIYKIFVEHNTNFFQFS